MSQQRSKSARPGPPPRDGFSGAWKWGGAAALAVIVLGAFAARGGMSGKLYAWGDELKPGGKWMANIFEGKFPVKDTGEDGFAGIAPVAQQSRRFQVCETPVARMNNSAQPDRTIQLSL